LAGFFLPGQATEIGGNLLRIILGSEGTGRGGFLGRPFGFLQDLRD
jgi:hypothetical protein